MLTLILGDAGSGKTTKIAEAIKAGVAAGRRIFLIVPEQETVSCERMMAEQLPPSAPLTFEVTNFTRLTDTVFRQTGGLAGATASAAAEQVLMWRTLVELAPLLKTVKERPNVGTVERMRGIMAELRAARLNAAMLDAAARNVTDPALKDKLADYALIAATYRDLRGEAYTGSADRLDRLAEMLTRYRPLDGYEIYIDGFSSFTEQQYAVLSALLAQADVTLALCLPENAAEQISGADALHTEDRLTRIAGALSVPVRKTVLTGRRRCRSAVLGFVAPRLFRADYDTLAPWGGAPDDALRLIEAFDPMEASDFVASDILRRVTSGEARFRDCTVVCATNIYRDIIDAALRKCGIPYFFSARDTLLTLEPVKLILSAIAIVVGGWRREDVLTYLKCPLSGVAQSDADAIALYSETWDLEGADLRTTADWKMSPDGYGAAHTKGRARYNERLLVRINDARRRYLPQLLSLSAALSEERSTPLRIRALTEFLLSLDLPSALDRRAEEQRLAGDNAAAEDTARIWDVICDTFDTLTTLAGDTEMNLAEFSDLLKLLFRTVTIGQIPASTEEVTVADAATVRSGNVRHVYLLGTTEGVFPGDVTEGRSFTEHEREALLAAGLPATDATDLRAARELFAFYRAFMISSDSVTVLWTRSDAALKPVLPSDAIRRLRYLVGDAYPLLTPQLSETPEALMTPALARERLGQMAGTPLGTAADAALGMTESDAAHYRNLFLRLRPETAALQYPGDLRLTQTRVQSYKQCPLSDFCRYVLQLQQPERAGFRADTAGTFVHAVLEKFLRLASERGVDYHALDAEKQAGLLAEVFPAVIAETLPAGEDRKPRVAHRLSRLRDITTAAVARICEDLAHTEFVPVFEELKIGDSHPNAPAPYTVRAEDGRNLCVYGTIDRVDAYRAGENVFVRVIDYKTGKKDYNEKKAIEKSDFQLVLYLSSLLASSNADFLRTLGVGDGGQLLPGGVLYLSSLTQDTSVTAPPEAADAERTSGASALAEKGIYFEDPRLTGVIDDRAPDAGLPSARSILPREHLDTLVEAAEASLRETAAGMTGGVIRAIPQQKGESHCAYCAFRSVCRAALPK